MKPWLLLSVLLQYPDVELLRDCDALERETPVEPRIRRFLDRRRESSLGALQAEYVETFDFDRRASLHLTYHTHGDRRQRGLELVRLKRRYAGAGLPLADTELPDYLPVLLEFATLAPAEGEALLNELRGSLEVVRTRLRETSSPYADLLDALVGALPRPTRAQLHAARRLAESEPPTELVGLEPFTAGAPS